MEKEFIRVITKLFTSDTGSLDSDHLFYGQADHPRRIATPLERPEYIKYTPLRHLMPELCCVLKGQMGLKWDDRFYKFLPGDYCYLPRMITHYECCIRPGEPYEVIWLGFISISRIWVSQIKYQDRIYTRKYAIHFKIQPSYLSPFLNPGSTPAPLSTLKQGIKILYRGLLQKIKQGDYFTHLVEERNLKWRTKSLLQARQYIDDHLTEKLTLERIARHINITPTYLSTLFRKEFGDSVFEYIIWGRLRQAQSLLETTNLTITEIAYRLQYNDIYYFSRLFKKNFGLSPKQFRDTYL